MDIEIKEPSKKSQENDEFLKSEKIEEKPNDAPTPHSVIPVKQNVIVRKLKILKDVFLEFSHRTDINCYGKIFIYNSYLIKFIWFLVLLCAISITGLILNSTVLSYFKYEVVSQIGVIYDKSPQFPAVTICDSNAFTSSVSQKLVGNLIGDGEWGPGLILASMITSDPFYGDSNRKNLGLNINMFEKCSYNNKDCLNELHWY